MSGFNRKTGLYELTLTKARWWSRFQPERAGWEIPEFAAALRSGGVRVLAEHPRWLEADAPEPRIYEVVRGPWRK